MFNNPAYSPLAQLKEQNDFTKGSSLIGHKGETLYEKLNQVDADKTAKDAADILRSNAISDNTNSINTLFDHVGGVVVGGSVNAITLTTPDESRNALFIGEILTFFVGGDSTASITLNVNGAGNVPLRGASKLFSGTMLTVVFSGTYFIVVAQIDTVSCSNISDIGKIFYDASAEARDGAYLLDGRTLNRADFPVGFAFISSLANYTTQANVDSGDIEYRHFFGDGDGSTTFTLADYRGAYTKITDGSRVLGEGQNAQVGAITIGLPTFSTNAAIGGAVNSQTGVGDYIVNAGLTNEVNNVAMVAKIIL